MRFATMFLLFLSSLAAAQDLVAVAPKDAKVEYEDARVRVVRLNIAANETLPMHDRPQRVVITLSANDVLLTSPDGKTHNTRVPAGNIAWAGAGKRSVKNFNIPVENIVVELKDARDPAIPVSQPPTKDDPRTLVEPHHKWLFENQYVRVYDVRIPRGEMTEFHTHAYDAVAVQLTDGLTSAQSQGGAWGNPDASKAGEVEFLSDSKKARIHRVRNNGTQDYRVVLVQLK